MGLDITAYAKNGKTYSFRAGSYSGYNEWRNTLSELMLGVSDYEVWNNLDEYKERPFYYLINFSDCEGIILGDKLLKLLSDFENNKEKAKAYDDGYWTEKYFCWLKAFSLASDGGYVEFH